MFGPLYADKGSLAQWLTQRERCIRLVIKGRKNMKPVPLSAFERALLRQRAVIETVRDQLKNKKLKENPFIVSGDVDCLLFSQWFVASKNVKTY